ncbi:LysR family transcriptional regulator [Rhodobacteraceae bacterium R_SAG2]|nr:LysR family transcriptional regulator [Rhodobacteraceae bacterium R_SAG2]
MQRLSAMNVKALRAFHLAFSEGGIGRAARIMNLSTPAVSRLISGLEGELRLQLFHRRGRGLIPTDEGVSFFREAGRILENIAEIPRIADDLRRGRSPSLRIVTMPRAARSLAAPAVTGYLGAHPDASISVDVRARRESGSWLAGRTYDMGIGALPVDNPEIRAVPLLQARAVAVLPATHAKALADKIHAQDLDDSGLIGLMPNLLMREQMDDFFRSSGIVPRFRAEVSTFQLAFELVSCGCGTTIGDALSLHGMEPHPLVIKPLTPERWMQFGILYPQRVELTAQAKIFQKFLIARARALVAESPALFRM